MIQNKETTPSGWFSLSINRAFSQQRKRILQGGFSRNIEKQNYTNGRKFGGKVSVDA
jgi:hypothetical protein